MNLQKYTQKSIEAIQDAQRLTEEHSNPQIEPVHLMRSLLTQKDGVTPKLFEKMNVNVPEFVSRLDEIIGRLPSYTTSTKEIGKY
ncbi:MAG: hypothetical protein IKS99_02650, partial [Firmicutes bacterium]|nr:hypothetical protein [Bacillota bacterium]